MHDLWDSYQRSSIRNDIEGLDGAGEKVVCLLDGRRHNVLHNGAQVLRCRVLRDSY